MCESLSCRLSAVTEEDLEESKEMKVAKFGIRKLLVLGAEDGNIKNDFEWPSRDMMAELPKNVCLERI